jgi:hypothetical protein
VKERKEQEDIGGGGMSIRFGILLLVNVMSQKRSSRREMCRLKVNEESEYVRYVTYANLI